MRFLPPKCKLEVKTRSRRFAAWRFCAILLPMTSAYALLIATLTSLLLLAGLLLRPARTH